jgi:transposase
MDADPADSEKSVSDLLLVIKEKNRRIAELEARVEMLLKELEGERRKKKRQAGPFSKNKRKKNPKKPGRKKGEGKFNSRKEPEATETPVNVRVDESFCTCGGELLFDRTETVTNSELPEIPKPKVTPFIIEVCVCDICGKTVRGKHPDVAPDQHGASAHRFGPRAKAAAHVLHYGLGVTVRKTPEVLRVLTGLNITQGAITQDALRQMRGPVGQEYQKLRDRVQCSDYVHTDDTGWKVGGKSAQLMVFETTGEDPVTVFQIRPRHRNDEVRELVPSDYAGTMTTDRGKSYDAKALLGVRQNKCVAHLLRNLSEAKKTQDPGAISFGNRLKEVIDEALQLWHEYHDDEISLQEYLDEAVPLKEELSHLLRDRELKDPANKRLLKELGKHNARGNLLRFLEDPEIEPTNNRAERSLRPAVIARKVSQCSKTDQGAEAHAGFMSVLRTFASRGFELLDGLTRVMIGNPALASPI